MDVRAIMQKRANLVHEARQLHEERHDKWTDEDEQRYKALMDDALKLGEQAEREQRIASVERVLDTTLGNLAQREQVGPEAPAYRFESRGMAGVDDLGSRVEWSKQLAKFATTEHRRAFVGWLESGNLQEIRALQSDVLTSGGYLVTPMQFVDQLIKAVDNLVFARQWATVFAVPTADSLGAPSLENDPADPTWTSELLTGSADSTMSFGRRELHPHPLAQRILISRKLLRQVPSVEALVRQRLAYKIGVVLENAYLNGTGAGQPLGVFTASTQGISTSRDYSTDNSQTAIAFDNLIGAKYTLKMQYWPGARWLFHRDGVAKLAKLVDGNGVYLWRESTRAGEPDRILGIPVFMSEYAPNTFTAGLYVGLLGDWGNGYWIADALNMEMQRLDELYAATNQVGFISRFESDGMPVLEEAFVRIKLAP